jgi:hypothetical protein
MVKYLPYVLRLMKYEKNQVFDVTVYRRRHQHDQSLCHQP